MIWILCLTTMALFNSLWAEPQQWQEDGVMVALSQTIGEVATATNSEGFTLDVWHQSQGGTPVVLGQMIGPDGTLLWEAGGRLLAQGLQRAGYPLVTAVNNGWVIVWFDAEFIEWCDRLDGGWCIRSAIRAIKIDNNGNPQWIGGRAGVEVVPTQEWWDIHPFALYPSGDGAIVTWQPNWGTHTLAIGVSGTGALWTSPVEITGDHWGYNLYVKSDDFGGLIMAWLHTYNEDTVVHANRMFADGELAWADAEGMIAVDANSIVTGINLAADGMGGAYIGWSTSESNEEYSVQHLNAQGEATWPLDGVELCSGEDGAPALDFQTVYNADTPDGLIAVLMGSNLVFRAQKLSLSGERMWGNCGVQLCPLTVETSMGQNVFSTDGQGGAVFFAKVFVNDGTNNRFEMRVSRIAANGTMAWTEGCVVAATETADATRITPASVVGNSLRLQWFEDYYTTAMYAHSVNLETGLPPTGDPLTVVTSDNLSQRDPKATTLTNGSTVIAWLTQNYNTVTPSFQIYDVFGVPQLELDGRPLILTETGEPQTAEMISICSDGNGGFFGAARIETPSSEMELRLVHLNGAGEHLASPQGRAVFDASPGFWENSEPLCSPDGSGGCMVTAAIYDESWIASSMTMRVNGQCELMWDEPVEFSADERDIYPLWQIPVNDHTWILVYSEYLGYPNYTAAAAAIGATGEVLWDVTLSESTYYPMYSMSACYDAQGGVYVLWSEQDGNDDLLMGQHITEEGELLWDGDGLLMASSAETGIINVACESDGLGNLTFSWSKWNDVGYELYAQRVTPSGELRWGDDGLIIGNSIYYLGYPQISAVSDNEVYIIWQNLNTTEYPWYRSQIYATHLNARGEIGDDSWWQEGGNAICDLVYRQEDPVVIADGAGGVLVAWADQRTSFGTWQTSVFAQRLFDPIFTDAEDVSVIPTEFLLEQNYPNPFNPETVIEFALPTSSKATIKVFDVTGREVATLLDEPLSAGVHRVNFNAQKLASGVYFYTLKADEHSMTKKMVMLK